MYPEVKTYVEALKSAVKSYNEGYKALIEKYTVGGRLIHPFWDEERKLYRVRISATEIAWDVMKSSEQPLIAFIADNCGSHKDDALTILKALPLTYQELTRLADDNDWCSVWDGFLFRALAKGLIPDGPKVSEERAELILWLVNEGDIEHDMLVALNERIDAVVNAEGAA